MTIYSFGYEPDQQDAADTERQFRLFCADLPLILDRHADIMSCSDYFFCRLPFAHSSWSFVAGDGQLFLGYLLLGWQEGSLTGECPDCGGKALVTSFSGSVFSGGNSWHGVCQRCQSSKNGSWNRFVPHWTFVLSLRQQFLPTASPWVEPVTLEDLLDQLRAGNVRNRIPPNQTSPKEGGLQLKFSNEAGETIILGD